MPSHLHSHRLLAVLLATACCAAPAWAGKDNEQGGKQNDKQAQKHEDKAGKNAKHANQQAPTVRDDERHGKAAAPRDLPPGGYFTDRHRDTARTYYVQHYGNGKGCPPGLAKKHNGCQPPGHAKRWNVGQPLPRDVVYYSVPQPVLVRLPPQPAGYRYVHVSGDVLLIAIGTLMVIDGMDGLLRM